MSTKLRLRLYFDGVEGLLPGQKAMLGPGKADLLAAIDETGSISAAGRSMGMSYKRAWMLVETMKAIFKEPVVLSVRGGSEGGGAQLTDTGRRVLEAFREMERNSVEASEAQITALEALAHRK